MKIISVNYHQILRKLTWVWDPKSLTTLEISGRFRKLRHCLRRLPRSITSLNMLVMNNLSYHAPYNMWSFLPPALTSLTITAASRSDCFGSLPTTLTNLDLYLEESHL